MNTKLSTAMIAMCMFTVSGCKQKLTYQYLMEHPTMVQAELDRCKSKTEPKTKERDERCEIVENAGRSLMFDLYQYQNDPEKFGLQIMVMEDDIQNLKQRIQLNEHYLKSLQDGSSSPDEIKKAQSVLDASRKEYDNQQEQLRVLLAIVSMNSPE